MIKKRWEVYVEINSPKDHQEIDLTFDTFTLIGSIVILICVGIGFGIAYRGNIKLDLWRKGKID